MSDLNVNHLGFWRIGWGTFWYVDFGIIPGLEN